MILKELYNNGYLDYKKMILDNSKALGLKASETVVLIKILECGTVSLPEISEELLMASGKLDKILASLMERGFYEIYLAYDKGKGKECLSFDPLFEKLEKIIKKEDKIDTFDIEKSNRYLASKLNRVLTASELEILQSLMVDDHYSYEQITEAVDKIVSSNKLLSMRTLTATLAKNKTQTEIKKETPKAVKDFFNKI